MVQGSVALAATGRLEPFDHPGSYHEAGQSLQSVYRSAIALGRGQTGQPCQIEMTGVPLPITKNGKRLLVDSQRGCWLSGSIQNCPDSAQSQQQPKAATRSQNSSHWLGGGTQTCSECAADAYLTHIHR